MRSLGILSRLEVKGRRGSTLIYAIVAMTIIASLAAAVATMVPTSYKSEISAVTQNQARYLAEAGFNYAQGLNFQYENDSTKTFNDVVNALSGYTYTFPGTTGSFTIAVTGQDSSTGTINITSTGTVGSGNEQAVFLMSSLVLNYTSASSNKPTVTFTVSGPVGGTPTITWAGATGAVHGTPTVVNAPGTLGLLFNSNCESLSINFSTSLAWTPKGTIMLWMNVASLVAWQGVMHKGVSTNSNPPYGVFDDEVWSLQFTDNGLGSPWPNQGRRRLTWITMASNTDIAVLNESSQISTGTWYHVAVTWQDSPTAGMTMYINGAVDNSTTNYLVPRNNNSDITIGAQSYQGACYSFNGSLADIQLWNKALPLTDPGNDVTKASVERAYCHGALALGGAPSRCNKYSGITYP